MTIALMICARLGPGAWDIFHQGLARQTGLPFGWTEAKTSRACCPGFSLRRHELICLQPGGCQGKAPRFVGHSICFREAGVGVKLTGSAQPGRPWAAASLGY